MPLRRVAAFVPMGTEELPPLPSHEGEPLCPTRWEVCPEIVCHSHRHSPLASCWATGTMPDGRRWRVFWDHPDVLAARAADDGDGSSILARPAGLDAPGGGSTLGA